MKGDTFPTFAFPMETGLEMGFAFPTFTFRMKTRKAELVFTMETGKASGTFSGLFTMKASLGQSTLASFAFAMETGLTFGIFTIFAMEGRKRDGIFTISGLGLKG